MKLNAEAQEYLVAFLAKWKADQDQRLAAKRLQKLRDRKKQPPLKRRF